MNAATALMSSFNRVGTTWAGGSTALMTNVLREEWGFKGVAILDFNLYNYMDCDQGMRADTDMQLTWASFKDHLFNDTTSATARLAIRKAIHNMLYTVVNSNAMQRIAPGTIISYKMSPWRIWFYVAEGILLAAAVGSLAWVLVRCLVLDKKHQNETAN